MPPAPGSARVSLSLSCDQPEAENAPFGGGGGTPQLLTVGVRGSLESWVISTSLLYFASRHACVQWGAEPRPSPVTVGSVSAASLQHLRWAAPLALARTFFCRIYGHFLTDECR